MELLPTLFVRNRPSSNLTSAAAAIHERRSLHWQRYPALVGAVRSGWNVSAARRQAPSTRR